MAVNAGGHGGLRPGAGRKPKAAANKIVESGVAAKLVTLTDEDYADTEIDEKSKEFLSTEQADGETFRAFDIYLRTHKWLRDYKCDKIVPNELVEQYAVNSARWQQCEDNVSHKGFLGKHPTTGGEIASPYVTLGLQYQKQANTAWAIIYQIVKENSTEDVTHLKSADDEMEQLLSKGKPKKK